MRERKTRATRVGVLLVLTMGGLFGCSTMSSDQDGLGGTRGAEAIQNVGGPEWLSNVGSAFSGEGRVFYGVGNTAGVRNSSMRRRSAEAAARRDIAQTLQVYVAGLNKQYMAETTAGDMERASVEQHIEDVMKQVTDATLIGANVVEYWEHPGRNESYALARLDLEAFLDAMQQYQSATGKFKELDAEIREYVRKNAAKAHEELNNELSKQ